MRPTTMILLLALVSPVSADECDRFLVALDAYDDWRLTDLDIIEAAIDAGASSEAFGAARAAYLHVTEDQPEEVGSLSKVQKNAVFRIVYAMTCKD